MSDTREHYEGELSRLRGIARTVNPLRVQVSQLEGLIRVKEMRIQELEKQLKKFRSVGIPEKCLTRD